MDSLPRRIGKLPVGQGHFSAVPSFGRDYSKGAQTKPESGQLSSGKLVKSSSPISAVTTYNAHPANQETRGQSELWSRDHSTGGRGPSPAVFPRQSIYDSSRRTKSIEPDTKQHARPSWMRQEPRSGSYEGDQIRRTGRVLPRPDSMYLPQTSFTNVPTGYSNEAEHVRNLEKSTLNLNLRPDSTHDQHQMTSAWSSQTSYDNIRQADQLQPQQPHHMQPQQPLYHYQQQQQQQQYLQPQQAFHYSNSSLQTPPYFPMNNTSNSSLTDMSNYPRSQSYDPNAMPSIPQTVVVGSQSNNWTNPTQLTYPGNVGTYPTAILAPPAYSLMGNAPPAAPGAMPVQPQIAIVATDPATLRALLSGSLAPHNLIQSLIIPPQPAQPPPPPPPPLPPLSLPQQPPQTQIPPQPQPQQSTQLIQQLQQQQQQHQPLLEQSVTQPITKPFLESNSSQGNYLPSSMGSKQPEMSLTSPTDGSGAVNTTDGQRMMTNQVGATPVSSQGAKSLYPTPAGGDNRAAHSERVDPNQLQAQTTTTNTHPDVITQARHCTSAANRKQLMKSQTVIQEEEDDTDRDVSSLPRIGHPPRTLRKLVKPELLLESSATGEEVRHTNVREPRKLNAEAFLEQSRRRISDVQVPTKETAEMDAWADADCDTIGRRREPISISAYYEKLKQQRGTRPLSAYRPLSTTAGKPLERPKSIQTAPQTGSTVGSMQASKPVSTATLDRQNRALLRRAVTFAAESNDNLPVQSHDASEGFHRTLRDPTIMSVAERARQWIEGRERDLRDTHRYSTCGFIDQDLIDCQELVPVEDRVKMFDSGNLSQKPLEETSDKTRIQPEPASRGPIVDRQPTPTPMRQEPRPVAPSRTVASMRLHATKSSVGSTLFPRPAVGLQHVRMGSPVTTNGQISKPNASATPTENGHQAYGDEFSQMSVEEKRRIFTRDKPTQPSPNPAPSNTRPSPRRKTQPVTLDDLARANQLILARLDGRSVESPPASLYRGDDSESFGFQERASEISTPEASVVSF